MVVTRAQLIAVAVATVVALAAGILFSASYANLTLGARDIGGAVMPPGMIMVRDTPGQAMREMSAVDPRTVRYTASVDARGDQPLAARLEDGVKVYDLDVSVIQWNILPHKQVAAYAFNRQVPGPRIRITEGERYDVIWEARVPGKWLLHCHIPHHTTNNNAEEQGAGGLTLIINVT